MNTAQGGSRSALQRLHLAIVLLGMGALPGCVSDPGVYESGQYRCDKPEHCAAGYLCLNDVCVKEELAEVRDGVAQVDVADVTEDTAVDTRDAATDADTKDIVADTKDTVADTRDVVADTRDTKDTVADTRDTVADTKDTVADTKDTVEDTKDAMDDTVEPLDTVDALDAIDTAEPDAADVSDAVDTQEDAQDITPPLAEDGEPCVDDSECQSAHCVDEVCCNKVCDGICEVCNLATNVGTCTAVPDGQDPDEECAGDHELCGGVCDGQGECRFPASDLSCGDDVCDSETELTSYHCDGSGECAAEVISCIPYRCDLITSMCYTSCTPAGSECSSSAYCENSACKAALENGEPCGQSSACQSGHCVDDICCNGVCNGTCEACDVAGKAGVCAPVPDDGNPDSECGGDTGCEGSCDGDRQCTFPAGAKCGACHQCDSSGDCDEVPDGPAPDGHCNSGAYEDLCDEVCENGNCVAPDGCGECHTCQNLDCEEVLDGTGCGTGQICCDGFCCDAAQPYCDPSHGCVQCLEPSDCSADHPECFDCTSGVCDLLSTARCAFDGNLSCNLCGEDPDSDGLCTEPMSTFVSCDGGCFCDGDICTACNAGSTCTKTGGYGSCLPCGDPNPDPYGSKPQCGCAPAAGGDPEFACPSDYYCCERNSDGSALCCRNTTGGSCSAYHCLGEKHCCKAGTKFTDWECLLPTEFNANECFP